MPKNQVQNGKKRDLFLVYGKGDKDPNPAPQKKQDSEDILSTASVASNETLKEQIEREIQNQTDEHVNSKETISLREQGINSCNTQDENGNTPLHILCMNPSGTSPDLVAMMLITFGADPSIVNNQGQTPLHILMGNNSVDAHNTLMSFVQCVAKGEQLKRLSHAAHAQESEQLEQMIQEHTGQKKEIKKETLHAMYG